MIEFTFFSNEINAWFRIISMHVKIHLTLQRIEVEKKETTIKQRNNKTQQQNIVLPSLLRANFTHLQCTLMLYIQRFCLCCWAHVYSISLILHLMTFRVVPNTKAHYIRTNTKISMMNTSKHEQPTVKSYAAVKVAMLHTDHIDCR